MDNRRGRGGHRDYNQRSNYGGGGYRGSGGSGFRAGGNRRRYTPDPTQELRKAIVNFGDRAKASKYDRSMITTLQELDLLVEERVVPPAFRRRRDHQVEERGSAARTSNFRCAMLVTLIASVENFPTRGNLYATLVTLWAHGHMGFYMTASNSERVQIRNMDYATRTLYAKAGDRQGELNIKGEQSSSCIDVKMGEDVIKAEDEVVDMSVTWQSRHSEFYEVLVKELIGTMCSRLGHLCKESAKYSPTATDGAALMAMKRLKFFNIMRFLIDLANTDCIAPRSVIEWVSTLQQLVVENENSSYGALSNVVAILARLCSHFSAKILTENQAIFMRWHEAWDDLIKRNFDRPSHMPENIAVPHFGYILDAGNQTSNPWFESDAAEQVGAFGEMLNKRRVYVCRLAFYEAPVLLNDQMLGVAVRRQANFEPLVLDVFPADIADISKNIFGICAAPRATLEERLLYQQCSTAERIPRLNWSLLTPAWLELVNPRYRHLEGAERVLFCNHVRDILVAYQSNMLEAARATLMIPIQHDDDLAVMVDTIFQELLQPAGPSFSPRWIAGLLHAMNALQQSIAAHVETVVVLSLSYFGNWTPMNMVSMEEFLVEWFHFNFLQAEEAQPLLQRICPVLDTLTKKRSGADDGEEGGMVKDADSEKKTRAESNVRVSTFLMNVYRKLGERVVPRKIVERLPHSAMIFALQDRSSAQRTGLEAFPQAEDIFGDESRAETKCEEGDSGRMATFHNLDALTSKMVLKKDIVERHFSQYVIELLNIIKRMAGEEPFEDIIIVDQPKEETTGGGCEVKTEKALTGSNLGVIGQPLDHNHGLEAKSVKDDDVKALDVRYDTFTLGADTMFKLPREVAGFKLADDKLVLLVLWAMLRRGTPSCTHFARCLEYYSLSLRNTVLGNWNMESRVLVEVVLHWRTNRGRLTHSLLALLNNSILRIDNVSRWLRSCVMSPFDRFTTFASLLNSNVLFDTSMMLCSEFRHGGVFEVIFASACKAIHNDAVQSEAVEVEGGEEGESVVNQSVKEEAVRARVALLSLMSAYVCRSVMPIPTDGETDSTTSGSGENQHDKEFDCARMFAATIAEKFPEFWTMTIDDETVELLASHFDGTDAMPSERSSVVEYVGGLLAPTIQRMQAPQGYKRENALLAAECEWKSIVLRHCFD